jgi:hypothetical protein
MFGGVSVRFPVYLVPNWDHILRRRQMARFNLDDYTTVAERIDLFWEAFPEGRILTQLVHFEPGQCVVRAEIFLDRADTVPVTSDYAEERLDTSPVNRTSMVENCTTSAIGRSLADLGSRFSGSKRASREEMQKVERLKTVSATPVPDGFEDTLASVKTLEELHQLWEDALKAGFSQAVVSEFSKRKEELGG